MKSFFQFIGLSITLAAPLSASNIGSLDKGISAKDSATGTGYILYNPEGLTSRLILHPGQASHFTAVYYDNGTWYYYRDELAVAFTPIGTDTLVAKVDYTADTVSMFDDHRGTLHGVTVGYNVTDIVITPNQWDGLPNTGEFSITGTYLTMNLSPTLAETPTGYSLQWSGMPNHTCFIMYSTDLQDWSFFPEMEYGSGNFDYGFTTSSDKLFLRLKYTSVLTTNPEQADFDGDGVGSLYEITHGLDPFKTDTDGDGTLDGAADRDDDGSVDSSESASGQDPLVEDNPAVKLNVSVGVQ